MTEVEKFISEEDYQQTIKFLRENCPAFVEREKRLKQLLSDRLAANQIFAHKLRCAENIDAANMIYGAIVSADQKTLAEAMR